MGDTYVFDIEADGLLDKISKVHCVVAINVRTEEVHRFDPNDIKSAIELLESADCLIAHNGIKYDYPALKKLYPSIKLPRCVDTLVLSRLIYADMRDKDWKAHDYYKGRGEDYPLPKNMFGRHSLDSWGYRLGNLKGDFGSTTDWSVYTPEMMEYCEQDCWVTYDLYEKLMKSDGLSMRSIGIEHDFCKIIDRQEQNGWQFDEDKAVQLYSKLALERLEIKHDMSEVFPGWTEEMKTPLYYKSSSIAGDYKAPTKGALQKQLKDTISDTSLRKLAEKRITAGEMKKKHTPFNPGSRQHIYKVFLEKYNWKPKEFTPSGEPKVDDAVLASLPYPEAKLLARYFMLEKRIGQIAEGSQAWLRLVKNGRIYGSVNTNGAVTGRCTHSHPNVAQVPATGAEFGKECRELFIARPGWKVVGADASGLELRCLAHYMYHWDKGDYAKIVTTGDIHTENQTAAGLPTRENAKTFIYAFLYGAGDTKIGSIVGGGHKAGKTLRSRFLSKLPALNELVKSVKSSAKKGYIKGLDGRRLSVRYEHAALNTLLQSAGAIIMKGALIEADRLLREHYIPGKDYEFIGNIHDEMQVECRDDIAGHVGECLVKGIRAMTVEFNFNCPLDGEYKIGDSWAETH